MSTINQNSSNMINSFTNIHSKISKIFQNPKINFFIIMYLILIISCYTFINASIKNEISAFISNPIIILFSLIIIIVIGYYNINIATLFLLLLFIMLYGSTLFNKNTNKNTNKNKDMGNIEGFTDDTDENEDENTDDEDDDEYDSKATKSKIEFEKKLKEDKLNLREDKINSIKDVLLGTVNSIKNNGENDYKKSLLENKQILYENEKQNNKINKKANSKLNSKSSSKSSNKSSNKSSKNNRKEEFQTIDVRKFDPSNEEDTNFLITKEILQDMINRINYNFESNKYLKKYIKHRIEEIVELNKLLDNDEE